MFRTIMEQLETDPVPLGTSHIPSHIPPRRCGGLCVIARGTKRQKPLFSGFSASVPWGLLKVYGTFFVWFLVGNDRGPVVISMRK